MPYDVLSEYYAKQCLDTAQTLRQQIRGYNALIELLHTETAIRFKPALLNRIACYLSKISDQTILTEGIEFLRKEGADVSELETIISQSNSHDTK